MPNSSRTTSLVTLSLFCVSFGCGDPRDSTKDGNTEPYIEAVCDTSGPKTLCRASVEGIRAHIEEFGPLQKEMDMVYLTAFDPNDAEELEAIEKINRLDLRSTNNSDMRFLSSLKEANSIRIISCDNLQSLAGLENLTFVGSSIDIEFNPSLASLTGLENLAQLGDGLETGNIKILQNNSLQNIEALGSLENARGIMLQNNGTMLSPGTLPSLTSLGFLELFNNDALESIGSFPSLMEISVTINTRNNDVFPDCEAEKLAESLPNFEGELILDNNKPNSRCADLE